MTTHNRRTSTLNRTRALLAALAVAIFAVIPAGAGADEADPPEPPAPVVDEGGGVSYPLPVGDVEGMSCTGSARYGPPAGNGFVQLDVELECVDPETGDVLLTASGGVGVEVLALQDLVEGQAPPVDPEVEPGPPDPETGTPATAPSPPVVTPTP